MKNKFICNGSLILNGIFIISLLILIVKFKEKINLKLFDKKKAKIVMFGDSLTKICKWEDVLNRNDIKNSGVGGTTTSDFVGLIHQNVIAYQPEICFIEGGINDMVVGISLDRIKRNYKSLIDTLVANGITPVVQSTLYQEDNPTSKILVDSLNNFLMDYCSIRGLYYLDINSKLSNDKGLKPEYSENGTHITEKAYAVWGKEINALLHQIESKETNKTLGR
jgi:lysophospholipase L1-like esterase